MTKRTFLVLTLVVLVLSLLVTGCSQPTATPTSSTTPTPAPANKHFTILLSENYDPKYLLGDTPVFKEWERLADVTITYETAPGGDPLNTIIQTRLASGIDLPDIMAASCISDSNAINLAKQGMIVDLTDLIPQYENIYNAFYKTYPSVAINYTSPDGHIYWIPSYIYGSPMEGRQLSVRTDWLTKLGMQAPKTVDELYNYLKACQDNDVNGNSKKDEIWIWDSYNGASYIAGAFGVSIRDDEYSFTPDANNKITASYVMDGTKAYWQWMNKLYTAGLVDPDPFAMSPDVYNNKLATNAAAAIFGPGYMAARDTQVIREQGLVADAQLTPIYTTMTGPAGDKVVNNPIRGYGKFFITKTAKEDNSLDSVLKWVDTIYSPYGQIVEKYGAEGQQWTKKADGTLDITGYLETFKRFPGIEGHAYLGTLSASPPKIEVTTVAEYLDAVQSYIQFGWDNEKESAFDTYVLTKSLPAVSVGIPKDDESAVLDAHKDLFSYMHDSSYKFITGAMSFDQWDAYVAQCKTLGLDDVTAAYQTMWDRSVAAMAK